MDLIRSQRGFIAIQYSTFGLSMINHSHITVLWRADCSCARGGMPFESGDSPPDFRMCHTSHPSEVVR